ncbi:MAG: hypothetical protein AAFR14_09130 [Bacteroidota bacterium]
MGSLMASSELPEKSLFDRVTEYYRGERISNAAIFFIGGAGITWTLLLFLWRQGTLSKGLFFSALPLGVFMIVTGGYRFYRSLYRYREAHDELLGETYLEQEELPHLEGRLQRFIGKRKVNITGFMIGISMMTLSMIFGWNHIFLGTAVSVTIFSSVLLVFDLFSQFRTEEFRHHLDRWQQRKQ